MLLTTLKNVELSEMQNFAKGGLEKLGGRKEIGSDLFAYWLRRKLLKLLICYILCTFTGLLMLYSQQHYISNIQFYRELKIKERTCPWPYIIGMPRFEFKFGVCMYPKWIFFFFPAMPYGLRDLNFLTRNQAIRPGPSAVKVQSRNH